MKVLFDARIHLNYFSGISRYIICLLDAYLKQFPEDQITVLLNPTINKDNSIYKVLEKYSNVSFQVVNTKHMGPINYLRLGGIIKKLNPEVYHYPHLDAPIFIGKIPLIATIHDVNSNKKIKKYEDRFGLKEWYFRSALRLTLRKAKKIIFVSESIKNEVLQSFGYDSASTKFKRIYNGLESDFNLIKISESKSRLQDIGISGSYFLYVGQIREHKNIERLIHAFRKANDLVEKRKLILVGHNYLKVKFSGDDVVHIEKVSGEVLKDLYSQCDAFLFPSLFEGFGFPILEAFAFGKPVVTTNFGATSEISGGLAILVNPFCVDAIADGIRLVNTNDGLSELRIQHAKKFNWAVTAKEVRQVYIEAIKYNT